MEVRHPWRIGAAVLLAALGLNLATGNGLWIAYTLVGIAAFTGLYLAEQRGIWRIPRGTLVGLSVLAALHFLGGSLAGVHEAFGVNGAYYVLPWWDNLAHFLGGALAWLLFDAVLRQWLDLEERQGATTLGALGVAVLAGVLVELYEFSGFLFFGTVDQGFYVNTMLDLYYDVLGGVAIAVWSHRGQALATTRRALARLRETAGV